MAERLEVLAGLHSGQPAIQVDERRREPAAVRGGWRSRSRPHRGSAAALSAHRFARCAFHLDNEGLRLTDVAARDGQTLWTLKRFEQRGYAPKSPFVLEGYGQQVHLDNKWAAALPPDFRKYWHYYEPAGDINVAGTLTFDGQTFSPNVAAHALGDVSFSFHKFPYRLDRGRGSVFWRQGVLDVSLLAFAGPQPVTLAGQFVNPGPKFTGSIEIRADKVAIDDKLFEAVLKPKSHDTLVSLNPTGTFNLYARFWRDDPTIREMRHEAEVRLDPLNRCSISYDKFPYPIDNLHGLITLNDGHWSFRKLAGTSGTGLLELSGDVSTVPVLPPCRSTLADNRSN